MNILVIGNGFDLAHGLPTEYKKFLEWIVGEYKFFYTLKEENAKITNSMEQISLKIPENINGTEITQCVNHQEEVWNCIDNNVWIEYFLLTYTNREKEDKNGWIDFESEISNVIRSLDDDMISESASLEDSLVKCSNRFLNNKFCDDIDYNKPQFSTYREIIDILLNDLNKLIRALEIYLTEYVKNIDCKIISPDIQIISPKSVGVVYGIQAYDTYVLSFNYTNTYQRLYNNKDQPHIVLENFIDYIHGKAIAENNIDTNNMVLGIDEYLPDDRKDKDTDFIAFKKYYQRIFKGTGCKYKEWVDEIKEDWENESEESKTKIRKCISRGNLKNEKIHNLYIFGHSLDVTDKDVLRDLILNDNVHTTIFYHSKDELGRKIANLVKVIGQDELIRRTGGSTKTIDFKEQQKMQERD